MTKYPIAKIIAFTIFVFLIIEGFSVVKAYFFENDVSPYFYYLIVLIISVLISFFYYAYPPLKSQAETKESNYKKILDTITDVIFIVGSKGEILFVNQQIKTILKYDAKFIIGKNFMKFIPPSEKLKYQRKLSEVFQNDQISNFETFILTAEGIEIPVEVSGKVMKYNGQRVAVGTIRDIEARKKAEQALIESEKNFRLLFENAPFGIYTATPEGKILDINNEALKMLGSPSAEATKKINILKFKPLIDNGYADKYRSCAKTGLKAYFDRKYRSLWGKESIILSQIIPLKDESGKVVKIYTVMQDISARKLAEQKLKEQNEEYAKLVLEYQNQNKQLIEAKLKADEANKLKSEFLTNMSHEIRTPMNAIIGFSEVLQMQLTDEKHLSYVDKIMASGNNLLELINGILDLSKIEAKQLEIKPEETDLRKIFDEILLIFSGISKQKQIPVIQDVHDNLPKIVLMDSFRLKQILMNLVGNALKFTQKGKITLRAFTQNVFENNTVELTIEVIDTGIGIPEEKFQTIFQSFIQLDQSDSRIYGGTGLGLAITRQLVELMGGAITVKSKIGKGSTFTVVFGNIPVVS